MQKYQGATGMSYTRQADQEMSFEEEFRLLSMVDVLEPLSQEELEELARRAPDRYLKQGEIFHTPSAGGERLFILKKGRVQVYEEDEDGHELTLSVVGGGTMLGEMALTGQHLSGVYVRALLASVICTLKRSDLEHLILRNPKVGLRLVRLLSERLRAAEIRLAEQPARRYRHA